MDYAAVADMVARFGEQELIALTDPDNNAAMDRARVQRMLADAQALADGFLGQAYRLPLAGCVKPPVRKGAAIKQVPPPQLTRIVCDVARYYLHDDLAPEHEVYRRYQDAMGQLKAIAAGRAQLACPWGGSPGQPLSGDAQTGQDVRYQFSPRGADDAHIGGYK